MVYQPLCWRSAGAELPAESGNADPVRGRGHDDDRAAEHGWHGADQQRDGYDGQNSARPDPAEASPLAGDRQHQRRQAGRRRLRLWYRP